MRIFSNRKTSWLLATILLFSLLIKPGEVKAQLATADAGNLFQNIINTVSQVASQGLAYSNNYKEYVLDPLASGFAKQIIRSLTSSIVNWINSGFEGSPAFIENPGAFFLDIADQATGKFISGTLADLCSPFSIDVRLALAFKYRPNVQERYACTLSTIIKNSKGAVENASINGFTAGDFRQGGWPAFVSLTTEPQNNIFGAYLMAESELSFRVASMQAQQRDELTQGRGFLSWKTCKATGSENLSERSDQGSGEGNYTGPERSFEGSGEGYVPEEVCTVNTPGSVIAGALDTQLGSPVRQLELADEFGEIVNALFAQLVKQVLEGGLSGVSSRSSGPSYLDSTISDLNEANSPQVQAIKTELLKNLDSYKKDTLEYKQYRDDALTAMLEAKNAYDSVKACYVEKLNAPETGLRNDIDRRETIESRIAEIDTIISTSIAGKALNLLTLAQEADERVKKLESMQASVNAAKTLNDLNGPSLEYSGMIQARTLITPIDLQNAKSDLSDVRSSTNSLKQDAMRKMQACQIYN